MGFGVIIAGMAGTPRHTGSGLSKARDRSSNMVSKIAWALFRMGCITAIVRGIFQWLKADHGIDVGMQVAIVIGAVESIAVTAPSWVGWLLAGGTGLLCTTTWEIAKYRGWFPWQGGEHKPALVRIPIRQTGLQFILEQKEPYIEINKIDRPDGQTDTQYFCRIGVYNNTNDTIRNVRVQLIIIKRWDNPLLPLNMKPRYTTEDNINLAPDEEGCFDIVQYKDVPDSDTEIVLCYVQKGLPNTIPKGKYRLSLAVFGETAPSERMWVSLRVDNSGELTFAPWIKRLKIDPQWRR